MILAALPPADFSDPALMVRFTALSWLWGLTVLAVLAALVWLAWWAYRREASFLRPAQRYLLWGLRAAGFLLVGMLLLRPVVVSQWIVEKPRPVWVLFDNSQSMLLRDERGTPLDRARVALAHDLLPLDTKFGPGFSAAQLPPGIPENPSRRDQLVAMLTHPKWRLLERFQNLSPVQPARFGATWETLGPELRDGTVPEAATRQGWLTGHESQTALADVLYELAQRGEVARPAALVVFTDGQDNASRRTLAEVGRICGQLRVPVHVVGLGASGAGNLAVKDLVAPEILFFADQVAVTVHWQCQGFTEARAVLSLTLGGREVGRQRLRLTAGEEGRTTFTFTPTAEADAAGRAELAATLTLEGPETFIGDNALRREVRLIDRKLRVLYIESQPRFEYKFLQGLLLRDRRLEARLHLTEGDPKTLNSGPPYLPKLPATRAEWFNFDVVIMGDVPPQALDEERQFALRDFVTRGGGLIWLAGRRHVPAEYAGAPVADLLPIEPEPMATPLDPNSVVEPFTPQLTEAGQRSEWTALADEPEENRKVWARLPGWHWFAPARKVRPGAETLLAHPTARAGAAPQPLLVWQRYGRGMVLLVAGEETWRWRYNTGDRFPARFWGQVIYRLGLPNHLGADQRVQLTLGRAAPLVGETVTINARVVDGSYRPWTEKTLTGEWVRLDAKDGVSVQPMVLEARPGQTGEYQAKVTHEQPGRYAVRIAQPDAAELEYRVSLPPKHELEVAGMAETELRNLARLSGGSFSREEDLDMLPIVVRPQTVVVPQREEIPFGGWWAWGAVVLVFVAEWTARKWFNLP
jgi:hypothetical protein